MSDTRDSQPDSGGDKHSAAWFIVGGERYQANKSLLFVRTQMNSTENQIRQEQEKFERFANQEHDYADEEERGAHEKIIADLREGMKSELPNLQRSAMLVSAFAIVEHTLQAFCRPFEDLGISQVRERDFAGRGIERAKNYLTKVVEADIPTGSEAWNEVIVFRSVRNAFIHRNGYVDEREAAAVRSYAAKTHFLTVSDSGAISLQQGCVEAATRVFSGLLDECANAVQSRLRELENQSRPPVRSALEEMMGPLTGDDDYGVPIE